MGTDRTPGIGEELDRDIFPEQSAVPDGRVAQESPKEIAYPSDRGFVERTFTMRVYTGFAGGSIGLVLGAVFMYFGAVSGAVSLLLAGGACLVVGGLLLLYGFALLLGWMRPRWWL